MKSEFQSWINQVERIQVHLEKSRINTNDLSHPLIIHLIQYPLLTWSDVYKFILQGTCGWAHLTSSLSDKNSNQHSSSFILQRLTDEISLVSAPLPTEILFELLDAQTYLGRINLRVWKSLYGEDTHDLFNRMVQSQATIPNSLDLFYIRWEELRSWVDRGYFQFNSSYREEILKWFTFIKNFLHQKTSIEEMPLVSHSNLYRSHYHPAYRIISQEFIRTK